MTKETLETFGPIASFTAPGRHRSHRGIHLSSARDQDRGDRHAHALHDGPATIRVLRKLDPRVKVIAASGLLDSEKVKDATGLDNIAFLMKERLKTEAKVQLPKPLAVLKGGILRSGTLGRTRCAFTTPAPCAGCSGAFRPCKASSGRRCCPGGGVLDFLAIQQAAGRDDLHARIELAQHANGRRTIHEGHEHVGHHDLDLVLMRGEFRDGFRCRPGRDDAIAERLERLLGHGQTEASSSTARMSSPLPPGICRWSVSLCCCWPFSMAGR